MNPEDLLVHHEFDALVAEYVRAYGPEHARGPLLHEVELYLRWADAFAPRSTARRRAPCPDSFVRALVRGHGPEHARAVLLQGPNLLLDRIHALSRRSTRRGRGARLRPGSSS